MQGVDYSTKQMQGMRKNYYLYLLIYFFICILRAKLYSTAEQLSKYYENNFNLFCGPAITIYILQLHMFLTDPLHLQPLACPSIRLTNYRAT